VFVVAASGIEPFSYQWRMNGTNLVNGDTISGVNTACLWVGNAQTYNAGSYSVVVRNALGSTTSSEAVLTAIATNVVAWGDNSYSQRTVPAGLSNAVAIAAGDQHSLALRADGTVVAWGDNSFGQTDVPAGLTNAVAIAAGSDCSLALRADGTVVAWGANGVAQAVVPAGLTNAVAIAAGGFHSLALRADGTVVAWGYNGQTNVPAGLTNAVAIAAGDYHGLVLRADGTVVAWGENGNGQTNVPAGLRNAVAIAAGGSHSLALRADGTVVGWGSNGEGQTSVPAGLTNAVAIAGGYWHSLALRADGTVVAWGHGYWGQTGVPVGLVNVVAIAGGYFHSLALIGNGRPFLASPMASRFVLVGSTVYFNANASGTRPLSYQWQCNGTNLLSATNALLTLTNVTPAQAGTYSVVVSNVLGVVSSTGAMLTLIPLRITTQPQSQVAYVSGTVTFSVEVQSYTPASYQWRLYGTNILGATNATLTLSNLSFAQAGTYSVVISNAFGAVTSTGAVLDARSFAAWGDNYYGQTNVPAGLTNVVAIAAGYYHNLALRADGTVVAWGDNDSGQTNATAELTNAVAITAGGYHNLALRPDGTVFTWGNNAYGVTSVPVGLTNVVAVAGGYRHSLALLSEGTVVAWGYNGSGQTSVPVGLTNLVAIAAAGDYNLALRADGTVVAWGYNGSGQTSVPAGLTNAVGIAAGGYHSMALRADGTVVAWGDNSYGQTSVPVGLTNVVKIAAGYYHSLALRLDGTVVAWGNNNSGQTSVPAGLSNVVAVAGGSAHSMALIGNGCPFLNSRLVSQLVFSGSTLFFRADASGTLPLTYQWQCNGTNILGATNSVLALLAVQQSELGTYQFIVTNASGSVTSSVALLTVINEAPSINSQPSSQTNGPGVLANFTIAASGSVPLSYQWRKDGTDLVNNGRISGVGSTSLTITNLQSSDAANYTVVVTNAYGSVTSSVATLTITSGLLDPSFDLAASIYGRALIVQPDHELLVESGYTTRLNSDGSLDGNFIRSTNGGVCMARQSDGKVVIGGGFTSVNGVGRNFVARLNSNGTLDTGFQSGLAWADSWPEPVQCVAVQANGQVLIGGNFNNVFGVARGNLARLNSDGTLDTNFLSGLAGTGSSGQVSTIVVQPDGKILVGGYFASFNGTPRNMVARLNYDGTLDTSFQNGLTGGYWSYYVSSLALKPDGKIVAGGYFRMSANSSSVAQLNANGTLDMSFQTSLDSSVAVVVVRSDGKVYIGGQFTTVNGIARNHIARLNANGTLDTGFLNGLSGATGTTYPEVYAIALDAGKVYIGGDFTSVNDVPRSYLARLFDDLPVVAPAISVQPVSREVPIGSSVSIGVTSTGDAPLYYQWRKNGTNLTNLGNISGATTANLAIASVQANDAGDYTVVVTNAYGSVTSSVAVLGVFVPLQIGVGNGGLGVWTNRFGFSISGAPGQVIVIEANTNLSGANWVPLQTNTLTSSPILFFDPGWTNYATRFYRARMHSSYQGIYTGQFAGQADAGGFAVMVRPDQTGVVLGYDTPQDGGVYADGFAIAANGTTSYSTTEGWQFSGTFTASGVSGNFTDLAGVPGSFSGTRRPDTGIQQANAGYYVGTFSGYYSGTARAILAADGTLFFFTDAGVDAEGGGFGTVNAGNAVSASNVPDGLTITGTLNATTKAMSGNYSLGSTSLGTWTMTRTESAY
jgi:uncharacterized delta-60 repeat protein